MPPPLEWHLFWRFLILSCSLQKEAPKGIDVVYDPVGGSAFQEALKVVNWGAQILIIGFASGSIPKVCYISGSCFIRHCVMNFIRTEQLQSGGMSQPSGAGCAGGSEYSFGEEFDGAWRFLGQLHAAQAHHSAEVSAGACRLAGRGEDQHPSLPQVGRTSRCLFGCL